MKEERTQWLSNIEEKNSYTESQREREKENESNNENNGNIFTVVRTMHNIVAFASHSLCECERAQSVTTQKGSLRVAFATAATWLYFFSVLRFANTLLFNVIFHGIEIYTQGE